eukprot:766541-Hanusia_phi.AAC.3
MQEANDTDIIVPDDFETVDDAVKYAVLEQGGNLTSMWKWDNEGGGPADFPAPPKLSNQSRLKPDPLVLQVTEEYVRLFSRNSTELAAYMERYNMFNEEFLLRYINDTVESRGPCIVRERSPLEVFSQRIYCEVGPAAAAPAALTCCQPSRSEMGGPNCRVETRAPPGVFYHPPSRIFCYAVAAAAPTRPADEQARVTTSSSIASRCPTCAGSSSSVRARSTRGSGAS